MSGDKRSLTDLCGGRFGIVPAAVSDSPDIANGAFRLYAVICGRAKPNGTCELCLKYVAKMLGVSVRTVQTWKRELELLGWLQQLHLGDKSIGTFRVIRDPVERNPVRVSNAIKVGIRSATKTPHTKKTAHPRCEETYAHTKNDNKTPLDPPRGSEGGLKGHSENKKHARQGNPMVARSESMRETSSKSNHKAPARHPDWPSWAHWLVATRAMNEETAWPWLMAEIDRLAKEQGISSEEAGWMLHHRLRREKETGE